jgi:hypothetical protein
VTGKPLVDLAQAVRAELLAIEAEIGRQGGERVAAPL